MPLPLEIWSQVAKIIWDDRQENLGCSSNNADLLRVVRTSHLLYQAALPFLYRHCVPGVHTNPTERITACLQTLVSNSLAAASVRHLSLLIPYDFIAEEQGASLGEKGEKGTRLATLISRTLERLDSLVSLDLQFTDYDPQTVSNEHLCKHSEMWARALLSPSTRFPFHLKSFSTDFAASAPLSAFLSLQQHLHAIHFSHAKLSDDIVNDNEAESGITFPPSLKSIAFTGIHSMEDFIYIKRYMEAATSAEDLVLDFGEAKSWEDADDFAFLPDVSPLIQRLKGLTLVGVWVGGLDEVLKRFTPLLDSLEFFCIVHTDSAELMMADDCMDEVFNVLGQLPNLKTVVYNDIDGDYLYAWLSRQPDILNRLHVYATIDVYENHQINHYNVEIYKNEETGLWEYRRLPTLALPNRLGSRITYDQDWSCDPEVVLDVSDLV